MTAALEAIAGYAAYRGSAAASTAGPCVELPAYIISRVHIKIHNSLGFVVCEDTRHLKTLTAEIVLQRKAVNSIITRIKQKRKKKKQRDRNIIMPS